MCVFFFRARGEANFVRHDFERHRKKNEVLFLLFFPSNASSSEKKFFFFFLFYRTYRRARKASLAQRRETESPNVVRARRDCRGRVPFGFPSLEIPSCSMEGPNPDGRRTTRWWTECGLERHTDRRRTPRIDDKTDESTVMRVWWYRNRRNWVEWRTSVQWPRVAGVRSINVSFAVQNVRWPPKRVDKGLENASREGRARRSVRRGNKQYFNKSNGGQELKKNISHLKVDHF